MKQLFFALPFALPVALSGCMTDPTPPQLVENCPAPVLQHLVGEPEAAVETIDYDGPMRVIHPDEMMTMDYRIDRLTINIDEAGHIASLACN
jgi:hypothetical protein